MLLPRFNSSGEPQPPKDVRHFGWHVLRCHQSLPAHLTFRE